MKIIIRNALVLILTPVVTVLFILFVFLICFPLIIYHWLIIHLARILKPKLSKPLKPFNRSMVLESLYSKVEVPVNILVTIQLKGKLEVELLRDKFQKNVLDALDSNGEPIYPELKQNLTLWMKYLFWKSVRDFKLEDYIYSPKNTPLDTNGVFTHEELLKYSTHLLRQPWSKQKPLWEIILLHNFIPNTNKNISHLSDCNSECERTILLFRFHHGLADALSILKLILKLFEINPEIDAVVKFRGITSKSGFIKRILYSLYILCKAPFEQTKFLLTINDQNNWSYYPQLNSTSKHLMATTDLVSMKHLKEIRDIHKVGFNALILAVITGAVREMMIKIHGEVPNTMQICLPVPLMGRSDKLENRMGMVKVTLPISEKDPLRRLQKVQKEFEKTKRSTLPLIISLLTPLGGCLPFIPLGKIANTNFGPTLLLSNIPTSLNCVNAFGEHIVEDVFGSISQPSVSNIGMFFFFVSYNGYGRIILETNQLILPNENQHNEMAELILKQIDFYSNSVKV